MLRLNVKITGCHKDRNLSRQNDGCHRQKASIIVGRTEVNDLKLFALHSITLANDNDKRPPLSKAITVIFIEKNI